MERVEGFLRLRSDLVFDSHGAGDRPVGDDVQDRAFCTVPLVGDRQRLQTKVGDQTRAADADPSTVHLHQCAAAGQRLEGTRDRGVQRSRCGATHGSPGQRMFRVRLYGRSEPKRLSAFAAR